LAIPRHRLGRACLQAHHAVSAAAFPGGSLRKPLYKPGSFAYVTNPLLALALEGSN